MCLRSLPSGRRIARPRSDPLVREPSGTPESANGGSFWPSAARCQVFPTGSLGRRRPLDGVNWENLAGGSSSIGRFAGRIEPLFSQGAARRGGDRPNYLAHPGACLRARETNAARCGPRVAIDNQPDSWDPRSKVDAGVAQCGAVGTTPVGVDISRARKSLFVIHPDARLSRGSAVYVAGPAGLTIRVNDDPFERV